VTYSITRVVCMLAVALTRAVVVQRWIDEYLKWNSSEYENLQDIWIPAIHIWTPDIFINNL